MLDDLYVPYTRPFSHDVPFYAPTSYSEYYDLGVQSVLMGLVAAVQDLSSCTVCRNRREQDDWGREKLSSSFARKEISNSGEDVFTAEEPVTSKVLSEGDEWGRAKLARDVASKGTSDSGEKFVTAEEPLVSHRPPRPTRAAQEAFTSTKAGSVSPQVGPEVGLPYKAGTSPEVGCSRPVETISPSLPGDFEGQNIRRGSENNEVFLNQSAVSGEAEAVEMESENHEERRAATMVQARVRGHLVRMTKPLVQLRIMSRIRAELKKLKEQAGDPTFVAELRKETSMAKVGFDEATMALLLQLDDIQGSHSLVRQIRKALVKDIVALQESVDGLIAQDGSSPQR